MNSDTKKPKISIVIPAYECHQVIYKMVSLVLHSLTSLKLPFEIVVVIDGKDESLFREVKRIKSKNIKIIYYEKNKGKGFAVKLGMEYSTGDYIGYIDAGLDISVNSLYLAIKEIIKNDTDIVCGSKKHPNSYIENYTILRRILTFGYNMLARILLGINYVDTQVGLKVYSKRLLKDVLPRLLVKRFAFEVEMLAVAELFGYNHHIDIPVKISFKDKSHAATIHSIMQMILDTVAVFYRLRILKYYQKNNELVFLERYAKGYDECEIYFG